MLDLYLLLKTWDIIYVGMIQVGVSYFDYRLLVIC